MSRYLSEIRIGRYGAYAGRHVGPLSPGLNVIFGPNEAGKSTLASFIGGVLFGWEEARGVNNTYRSADGPREGELVFAQEGERGGGQAGGQVGAGVGGGQAGWKAGGQAGGPAGAEAGGPAGGGAPLVVSRDEQGASGVEAVTADVDRATWRAVFSLNSEELRSLRISSDLASRLLTAGSGTGASPADAFVEIEQRIAEHTSRAPDALSSALRLDELLEEKRREMKAAAEQVELWKQEDRELSELAASQALCAQSIAALDGEIAGLSASRAELEALDVRSGQLEDELGAVEAEMAALAEGEAASSQVSAPADDADGAEAAPVRRTFDARLLAMDGSEERIVRDKLDELADEQAKLRRQLDRAKEMSAASSAAYEALLELDEPRPGERRAKSSAMRAATSILLPIAFIAAGIPLFVRGRQIASLSFTALGLVLVVLAFFLAAAAIVVLFRPDRGAEALEGRRQDAQWVMLQDRKKLAASTEEMAAFDAEVRAYFELVGLSGADGSIRQARALLDGARERRALIATNEQRRSSLQMRRREAERGLAEAERMRRNVEERAGLAQGGGVRDIDVLLREAGEQRSALQEAARNMSRRAGELSAELERARNDRTLDRLKLEYQQLRCRLRESKHELVSLLLARRMVERSIAVWESQGQPEVYAQASRLFELICGGRWKAVGVSDAGAFVAIDGTGAAREVRHLSLGTCQQLYLALRLAVLSTADSVGRAIPVLADDILVNFDAERRAGAARALAELAETRQVIVFTCHEETLAALRAAAAPDVHYL